ncbi:MAG: hypothetical protein LBC30_04250 [Puniceicoccales bacterium]|nr:hypothetical protein [Puniceicoccales bacterium]
MKVGFGEKVHTKFSMPSSGTTATGGFWEGCCLATSSFPRPLVDLLVGTLWQVAGLPNRRD